MKKYSRICNLCGKRKRLHTIGGRCRKCYDRARGMLSIPSKECANCAGIIPKNIIYCGHRIEPAQYRRRKFCSRNCASSYNILRMRKNGWESSGCWAKVNKPPQEELHRLFSQLKKYSLIAKRLGVSKGLISKWLGPKEALLNPKYYD